ncbi:MAG: CopY family transcriptional regulator [Acidobacteria bacterium]|nr:MAG: CopY family transcriptional regulator [Acidobacteriota bacterium]
MAKKAKPGRFTEAELELMNILWERGPSTVQGVVDYLPPGRPLAYTTVQTVLNVLHRKGSVRRKLRGRAYHYEPAVSRLDAASTALRDLTRKLFGGSAEELILAMVKSRQLSRQKLSDLRKLVEDADGRIRK